MFDDFMMNIQSDELAELYGSTEDVINFNDQFEDPRYIYEE